MDVIRSAFVGKMRFREGDAPVPVTWFFAARDAAVFEQPTLFRAPDWESDGFQNDGLGVQYPPRGTWRNGMRPAGFDGKASCTAFLPAYWFDGIPATVTLAVPRAGNGVPVCCAPINSPFDFQGKARVKRWRIYGPPSGVLFGGSARTSGFFAASGGLLFNGSAEVNMPSLYLKTIMPNPTPGATFTGTFTTQPWTVRLQVTAVAPGGGGGGADADSTHYGAGGGGSAGATKQQFWTGLTGSVTYPIQIGGLGPGGAAGAHNGGDGTADTVFTGPSTVTAAHGLGGQGGIKTPIGTFVNFAEGGAPPAGGMPGFPGIVGPGASGNTTQGGAGGTSTVGGGGNFQIPSGAGNDATTGTGSGGGGAAAFPTPEAGGDGADGFLVMEEWNF